MLEIETWLLILIMLLFFMLGFVTAIWVIAIIEVKKIVKKIDGLTLKK